MTVSENHATCWVHKDFTCTDNKAEMLQQAVGASGGKDECQARVTGIEREYWMGTEIGRLGGHGFHGAVTACNRSNQKGGKMEQHSSIWRVGSDECKGT